MVEKPVGIAIVGIGMWCKALATVMQKSGAFKIVTCYTRTKAKRKSSPPPSSAARTLPTKMS